MDEQANPGGDKSEAAARVGRVMGERARAALARGWSLAAGHEDELRRAGLAVANLAASRVPNPALRPIARAAAAELAKRSAAKAPPEPPTRG